ncbi:MAG: flagellar basal body protein [Actinomycetia bacterium]|nr:flagellar basal body protein [Actinomycetes bacterium]
MNTLDLLTGGLGPLLTGAQAWSLETTVLANDIANANTPGFQAETVSFAQALDGALTPQVVAAPGLMTANGNGVNLPATLVQLEEAAGRLQGLDSLIGARLQALNGVITNLEGA